VLDSINLIQNNSWQERELLSFLISKAEIMLEWLKNMSYKNGETPLFNDTANGIAPSFAQLIEYSKRLNIKTKELKLKESGYRKVSTPSYECMVDIGHIGAEYIAGHAHSDTFNFELRFDDREFIVDTGLGTYEISPQRDTQRSTHAHNTVEINNINQSDVWGGFRVANRARVIKLKEGRDFIEATHNGYKPILHTRRWNFSENAVTIEDRINTEAQVKAILHFHPSISKKEILKHIEISTTNWRFVNYKYSPRFNTQIESLSIEINFKKHLLVKLFY